jgi:hypothetical protein
MDELICSRVTSPFEIRARSILAGELTQVSSSFEVGICAVLGALNGVP